MNQTLNTLIRDGFIKPISTVEKIFHVSLQRVILPVHFSSQHRLRHMTRPHKVDPVEIRRDGDNLLIGGMELDEVITIQRQHSPKKRARHSAANDTLLDGHGPHTPVVPPAMHGHVYLHPNIGIAMYYLQDIHVIPERYIYDPHHHVRMVIPFKGVAFKDHHGKALFFSLRSEGHHWLGSFSQAETEIIFHDEWVVIPEGVAA